MYTSFSWYVHQKCVPRFAGLVLVGPSSLQIRPSLTWRRPSAAYRPNWTICTTEHRWTASATSPTYQQRLKSARYRLSLCKYLLVQVHDQTLVNINNHLVNGGSNDLDGGSRGGGNQLNTLKQEILTELERRVSLSCSACQVNLSVQPSETAANISVMCLLAISVVVKCFYFPACWVL